MGEVEVWEHVTHVGEYRNAYIYLKKDYLEKLGVDGGGG
jgi:hypothetical protein